MISRLHTSQQMRLLSFGVNLCMKFCGSDSEIIGLFTLAYEIIVHNSSYMQYFVKKVHSLLS